MNTAQLNVEAVATTEAVKAKPAKNVAYSPEQVTELLEGYASGMTVEALALQMGKNVKSIVARLSNAKVYIKKERLTKAGTVSVRKESLADSIGEFLGLSESLTDSLAKTNKQALVAIWAALQPVEGKAE